MTKLTIAEAARRIVIRDGLRYMWFGQLDAWAEAYELATGKHIHPKDMWQRVRNALAHSKLFRPSGRIRASDWAGREIRHPVYVLVGVRYLASRAQHRNKTSFQQMMRKQLSPVPTN